jgi:hypothetical protein
MAMAGERLRYDQYRAFASSQETAGHKQKDFPHNAVGCGIDGVKGK